MPASKPVRSAQIPALTSLRFFAAVGVVLFHYLPRSGNEGGLIFNLINHAYSGVSFFFVLSGFVLAYTHSEKPVEGRNNLASYYARRVARIYPAFFVATLAHWPLFVWAQLTSLPSPDDYVRMGGVTLLTFGLFQSFVPWSLGQLNAPSWSVSVELFLYACLPWLVLWLGRMSNRRLLWVFLVSLVVCWVPALLNLMLPHHEQGMSIVPLWMRSPYPLAATWISTFPPFHLPQFVVGTVAGLWVVRSVRALHPVRSLHVLAAVGLVLAMVILGMPRQQSAFLDMALNHGALAGCFAVLFAWLALFPDRGVSRLFSARPLVALGDASYAMYILQTPVMAWVGLGMKKCGTEDQPFLGFSVGTLLLIITSLLCTRWENRVRPDLTRVLTLLFSRRRQMAVAE